MTPASGMGVRPGAAAPLLVTEGPPLRAPPVATAMDDTALTTPVLSGMLLVPVVISWILLVVALKLVGAMAIWLFARSYTTYADRRKVSPRTGVEPPVGPMPVEIRCQPRSLSDRTLGGIQGHLLMYMAHREFYAYLGCKQAGHGD